MKRIVDVKKVFRFRDELSPRSAEVMRMFGVDVKRLREEAVEHRCRFEIEPGQICYFTGPSGSGKSVLLREVYQSMPSEECVLLDEIALERDRVLVDLFEDDLLGVLRGLSRAGLNDVFTILNKPTNLSDGQKYRYRLARALNSGKMIVFADEFCTNLDRITASVIASNIRKIADRTGQMFFLASAHDDILAELRPDVLVVKHLAGEAEVVYK